MAPPFPPCPQGYDLAIGRDFYDVTEDGQRFLMARAFKPSTEPTFVLVTNFFEELKRRLPN